ncbi:hypothetical protein [Actinoplanes sp. NPDC051859]|uniref:hypothetical protein n=1 Tax=Actinoplanes sp. NPDC051859 TaxID=3363909 RepID=UPI003798648B
MTPFRYLRTATAAATLVLLGACAQPGTGAGSSPSSAPAAAPPTDGDALVLRVKQTGGFAGPEMIASRIPDLSVYADGRLIFDGPVTQQYPGPALPNVLVRTISPEQVRQLTEQATAAGVRDGTDYGQPGVADASTTEVTVTTSAGTQTVAANALREAMAEDPQLTTAQQEARAKLRTFLDGTDKLLAGSGAQPYLPETLAVVVRPYVQPGDDLPRPQPVAWPGPALPGEALAAPQKLSCVSATGDQRDAVFAAAKAANSATPWSSGGNNWAVTFRPLLPGESGCADLKAAR